MISNFNNGLGGMVVVDKPSAFISYSWDHKRHEQWVVDLANELRKAGVDARVDRFITQRNTVNLNRMMVDQMRDCDFIIVVLTMEYCIRCEENKGGVGFESTLLLDELRNNLSKVVLVVRDEGAKQQMPYFLRGIHYIDFSDDCLFDKSFDQLLRGIYGVDMVKVEPLGEKPNLNPLPVGDFTDDGFEPPVLREITDLDKTRFLRNAFEQIVTLLNKKSAATRAYNDNFEYDLENIDVKTRQITYYVNGNVVLRLRIWCDSGFGVNESIFVSLGNRGQIFSSGYYNEQIVCEEIAPGVLGLKMLMAFNSSSMNTVELVAKSLWESIVPYFER